jgi:hypothetical protein
MNALQQVVRSIYQQQIRYMKDHITNPKDLVIRVRTNYLTRQMLLCDSSPLFHTGVKCDDQQETIMGGPLECSYDIPNDTYYLDLLVCNQVVEQLKFTLQGDGGTSS